ncbi:hypothetical protein [Streptomyces boncukensis]|uniref:IrrE N-terminal-like domain-containing protein n=1 Tax=Streptomyces boncukensis TaxID=2711219 RepID=A0A6G4WP66_9ACTN|nr:hypothetical protein [Streptomyces boncukensis]NGO66995.1 hypothetical protein [Streptomyces boncukensis]
MIRHADGEVRRALKDVPVPDPLTVESLFAIIQNLYPRPLELQRGAPPLEGLRANGLWLTRPHDGSDAIWIAPELTGAVAVHSLAHEFGHFLLGHPPVEIPTRPAPEPEPFHYLSPDFLGGCLIGRARSQDGPRDPEYVQIEDQAERFAFALRHKATALARENRHCGDALLHRLYKAL